MLRLDGNFRGRWYPLDLIFWLSCFAAHNTMKVGLLEAEGIGLSYGLRQLLVSSFGE